MAKKTIDWENVAKDREVLARVEDMVKEGAAMGGVLPKEICDELNALTGNKWTGKKYKEFCDVYDFPWEAEEVVYALFHNGEFPDKKEEEWFAWKIEESIDSDQDAIAFFYLCQYEDDSEKCNKYEQVDVKPLNEEILRAFAGWEIEEDWEKNDFVTFCCSNKETYGLPCVGYQ